MSEPESITKGRTYYARLCHASLIIIPNMLQHLLLFYEPPQYLIEDLNKSGLYRFLSSSEKGLVKNAKSGYEMFDIPLIYKLLRNLHLKPSFPHPRQGWDSPNDPFNNEINEGDDLERCRRSRNKIVHRADCNIDHTFYKKYITMFAGIARRLGKRLAKGEDFVKEIQEIDTCNMDEEMEQKYLQDAQDYKATIKQLEGTVERLSSPNDEEVELLTPYSQLKCVEGEKVSLECVAIGGTAKAVWYRDGEISRIPTDAFYDFKNVTIKLVIPSAEMKDSGVYTVKVGNMKHDINLNVIERVSSLSLRNYQQELAEIALSGKNTIVCAGTNAGKTHIALYVIENHLLKYPDGKVVFINGTNVLLEQQYRRACDLLKSLNEEGKIYKWEAGTDLDKDFLEKLEKTSLMFLTPKSLTNHLEENVAHKIPIGKLSLIVFDECHHTYSKDLYNEVMKYYRIEKFKNKAEKLPQILGLTASPGTNRATNEETAADHLKKLMANLSVSQLSVVRKYENDLLKFCSTPVKVHIQSRVRADDPVKKILLTAIKYVESKFNHRIVTQFLDSIDDKKSHLSDYLRKPPEIKTDTTYIRWMAETRKKIIKVLPEDPQVPRLLIACINHLEFYAECLEVNSMLEIDQVRDVFNEEYGQLLYEGQAAKSTEENQIVKKLKEVKYEIFELGTEIESNPDINEIVKTMEEEYAKLEDQSRFLIFVKNRATAKALAERLPEHFKCAHLTGSHASKQEGGVTITEQLEVVDKFREGNHLCIVATSVGCEGLDIQKCNLMIRYRFHADEISSLQMRGRIRQRGGREVLVASEEDLVREIQNVERQYLMKRAIEIVTESDQEREITFNEKQIYDTEEAERKMKEMKISRKRKGEFSIRCKKCDETIANGRSMRHIKRKHFIIQDPEIFTNITLKPTNKKMKRFDGVQKQEQVFGTECKHKWGSILIYRKSEFVALSQDDILFYDVKQKNIMDCRKWSDLEFIIDEILADDITSYETALKHMKETRII